MINYGKITVGQSTEAKITVGLKTVQLEASLLNTENPC